MRRQRRRSAATGDPKTGAGLGTAFTHAERTLVSNAALAKCDALDGLADGLIQDTNACQAAFSFERDVPTCGGARNGSCLSAAQKTAIAPVFSGATTSDGKPFYASFPFDSGHGSPGVANWEFGAPLDRDAGAVGMIFEVPPVSPAGFDGPAFTLNSDIDALVAQVNATNATYTDSAMSFMTPRNPADMSQLKNRGAKILIYHGVSDAIFSVNDTEALYKSWQANNGGDASDFARFYRVSGMGHCSGGPATDQFDLLTPLVQWVEQGRGPHAAAVPVPAGRALRRQRRCGEGEQLQLQMRAAAAAEPLTSRRRKRDGAVPATTFFFAMPDFAALPEPAFRFFADLNVSVATPQEVGRTVRGLRRLIPITGGSAAGDGWRARVLPGGADFQLVVSDRLAELDARYVLETDAGDLIYVRNRAVRSGPPELIARLVRGEPVDPASIYFKCSPSFETASSALSWIAERMFFGSGARHPDRVVMRFFELI